MRQKLCVIDENSVTMKIRTKTNKNILESNPKPFIKFI